MADSWGSTVRFALFILLFCSVLGGVEPLRNSREKAALYHLRSSLGLRTKDWPKKVDPCLRWKGVQCQNGHVIGLNLSGLKRSHKGRMNPQFSVDSLANLTLLASFNASGFLLPGSIPNWFGKRLHRLQVLDLRSCSIAGAITSSLGNLKTLNSLYLSNNSLTSIIPPSLGQLMNLSVLDLSHNMLNGSIPSFFSTLTNLIQVDLSSNFLSGPIPPDLGALSRLRFLNLSSNNLSAGIPAQLGGLSSLFHLDLSSNSLSGTLALDLGGMKSLQKMLLGNNFLEGSLQNALFSSFIQLQFVVLSHNNFSDIVPNSLWLMPGLQYLDVSCNNLTGILPNRISNANAALPVVNASNNQFFGNLISLVGRFSVIDLSNNYFEGNVFVGTLSNASSLVNNCLQNESNQRSLKDCSSFYAKRGLNFGASNKEKRIVAAILGGCGLIVLLVLVLPLILCRKSISISDETGVELGLVTAGSSRTLHRTDSSFSNFGSSYTYEQLLKATSYFNDSNLIKNGHSGDLFQGELEGGTRIVVKRTKEESYKRELDFFSRLPQSLEPSPQPPQPSPPWPRWVPLLGHCLDLENEKFLVYKYMLKKDLSNSLHKRTIRDNDTLRSLDWITRLKIAIGAAEGLSSLHHEFNPPLVHRDVQASSILLDEIFEVHLGSLSEVCIQEGDTHPNVIKSRNSEEGPSDSGSQSATWALDVYCFGKVLLELVTGKLGISASDDDKWLEQTLSNINVHHKENLTNIMDQSLLVCDDLLEEVWAVAILARLCLDPRPSKRPNMKHILKGLENPLTVVTRSGSFRRISSRGSWRHNSSDITVGLSGNREGGNV